MDIALANFIFSSIIFLLVVLTFALPYFLSKHSKLFKVRKYVRWLAVVVGIQIILINILSLIPGEGSDSMLIQFIGVYEVFGYLLSMYGIPYIVLLVIFEITAFFIRKYKLSKNKE